MLNKAFDFEKEVNKYYKNAIVDTKKLSEIAKTKRKYTFCAIYALYENNQLKKIGKAIYGGIHHRMVQYYNGKSGSKFITVSNRNYIVVKYFTLKDKSELWYAERRLQVIAHDSGEKMEWENTSRN